MRKSILVLVAAALAACTQKPAAFEVGSRRGEMNAVAKRAAQVRLLRPETTDGEALASIVDGWVAEEILAARGKGVSEDELAKERVRLESDEQIARLYREVAKIYGEDEELFLQVALLPDMALRRAAETYHDEAAGSSESQETASSLLRQGQKEPAGFAAAATGAGADVREIVITAEGVVRDDKGVQVAPFSNKPDVETATAKRLYTLAQGAKAGDMLGVLLRTPAGHLIARKLADEKDGVRLVAAVTRNTVFGEWLQKEAKALANAGKLKVCIHDETLRKAYASEVKYSLLLCPAK